VPQKLAPQTSHFLLRPSTQNGDFKSKASLFLDCTHSLKKAVAHVLRKHHWGFPRQKHVSKAMDENFNKEHSKNMDEKTKIRKMKDKKEYNRTSGPSESIFQNPNP